MSYSVHALGAMTSNLPIVVSIIGTTAETVQDGVDRLVGDYPAKLHGTSPGPVVRAVTGQFKCSMYLIPGTGGDIKKWGLLHG